MLSVYFSANEIVWVILKTDKSQFLMKISDDEPLVGMGSDGEGSILGSIALIGSCLIASFCFRFVRVTVCVRGSI